MQSEQQERIFPPLQTDWGFSEPELSVHMMLISPNELFFLGDLFPIDQKQRQGDF